MDRPTPAQPAPSPEQVADFLSLLTRSPWPATRDELSDAFTRWGFTVLKREDYADGTPSITRMELGIARPGFTFATFVLYRGRPLALHLFLNRNAGPEHERVLQRYAQIGALFGELMNDPVETWGTDRMPASCWAAGELDVALYCFDKPDSVLMLCVDHREIGALAEAEAVARHSK